MYLFPSGPAQRVDLLTAPLFVGYLLGTFALLYLHLGLEVLGNLTPRASLPELDP